MSYEAIVIGVSSGGLKAMKIIFSHLPKGFKTPIIIVQHVSAHSDSLWIQLLNDTYTIDIKEADEKEKIEDGKVYFAPPNYHLLIEKDKTFSLTIDERVNYARPSIDVLFESAAEAYKNKLIGIILTGSNSDGTNGIKRIQECGGLTIVQDPKTAEAAYMPRSAIAAIQPDYILSLEEITALLIKLCSN
ncbi:chemotaxis protein CheB [Flavobacterium franklandianum]|uniref:protein-glutamate methylesterase n=2 Tax=Flavobacterium franklandianum TaxID=2594430 RepID=A0A553CJL5_9FLAO|nr:chemotaxis protein CheB [Flavobacterium franklandianum]TRX20687.1 chemotaxis protein CheB [Flavobacterium franklandianum]TRX29470.1 chemotaxis protein CheB [Flavobacterium franklandianum]